MNAFAPNSVIFKMILVAILPIVLILLYCAIWSLAYCLVPKYCRDIKRNIIISSIVILYLLHPALVRTGLGIFQCVEVSKNDNRARVDLDIK